MFGQWRLRFHQHGHFDRLPRRVQLRAKTMLREILEAPAGAETTQALERFRERSLQVPDTAVEARGDWEQPERVLRFPSSLAPPANPHAIESIFATVKARHPRHEGCRFEEGRAGDRLQALGRCPGAIATVHPSRAITASCPSYRENVASRLLLGAPSGISRSGTPYVPTNPANSPASPRERRHRHQPDKHRRNNRRDRRLNGKERGARRQ